MRMLLTTPLASASIAQVHAATLHEGREVVVKVLRPGIEKQIAADIALLNNVAAVVERAHPSADKSCPREIVAEIQNTLAAELDLQREAGNAASLLRRNWQDLGGLVRTGNHLVAYGRARNDDGARARHPIR